MSRTLAAVLVGLAAFAVVASAGIPDPDLSTCELTNDSGAGMATCPAGDGPAYQYIKVTAKRADGSPIEGIPYTSFFFTVTGGDVTISHVDEETDVNGEIRFEMTGDETIVLLDPDFLQIEVQIYTVALNDVDYLECNSYDINEDDTVGLADFSAFSQDYGTTAKRSDFNWDGTVGLADFSQFSQHYGH